MTEKKQVFHGQPISLVITFENGIRISMKTIPSPLRKRLLRDMIILLLSGLTVDRASAQVQERHVIIHDSAAAEGYYFYKSFRMTVFNDPAPGQQVIMDGKGETVFYRLSKIGSDFRIHPNGKISFFGKNKFYLMDGSFRITDSVACANGRLTDSHDFVILPDGHYLLLGQETLTRDMSRYRMFRQKDLPGSKKAKVITGVVQELDQDKKLVYEWRSAPYFRMEDAEKIYLNDTAKIDITHFNSVDKDPTGKYLLVSARYSNELVKVRIADGKLMWRLGGKKNDFNLNRDSAWFLGQHDARFLSPTRIILFDNGYAEASKKHPARAVEYIIDEEKKQAVMHWSYTRKPYLVSDATGNAQRTANGNTLVNYGKIQNNAQNIMFDMVKPDGAKIIEVSFKDTCGTYRAYYYPQLPFALPRPVISGPEWTNNGFSLLTSEASPRRWSNGDTAASTVITQPGDYYLDRPHGDSGWVRSKPFRVTEKMLRGPDTLRLTNMSRAQHRAYSDLESAWRASGGIAQVLAESGFRMKCGSCETLGGIFRITVSENGTLAGFECIRQDYYCNKSDKAKAMQALEKAFRQFLSEQKFDPLLRGKVIEMQTGFYSKC